MWSKIWGKKKPGKAKDLNKNKTKPGKDKVAPPPQAETKPPTEKQEASK